MVPSRWHGWIALEDQWKAPNVSAIPKACNEPVCWSRQIVSPHPRV